jgi:hypothetical protein
VVPHNPVLLLTQHGHGGRARRIARAQPKSEPLAIDLAAWLLVMEHLRRPGRPPIKEGGKPARDAIRWRASPRRAASSG